MVKAYLAGDMLKRGSQLLRSCERVDIEKLGTVALFNPMDNKEINDKATNPTAEKIFAKDTEAILESEIIIAEVDNNNVGTTSEMGQIWGINYMLKRINATGCIDQTAKLCSKGGTGVRPPST
jgi:nucleoside 2-deoxyribosyltransferase